MTTELPLPNLGGTSSTSPHSYFGSEESQARLQAIARSWLHTPFHPHACIRGAGVDCVHLCAAIYIEAGLLERFNPPKYALDGGKHSEKSLVTEWVNASGRFDPIEVGGTSSTSPHIGDLLCLAFGKHVWHVGIMLDAHHFIHAIQNLGVIESSLRQRQWSDRLTLIYRPIAAPRQSAAI